MSRIQIADGRVIEAPDGANLLRVLRDAGIMLDAPCGGVGRCGKCRLLVNERAALACRTQVVGDMRVVLPEQRCAQILTAGDIPRMRLNPLREGPLLAFDIGTTTLVCYLLDGETGVRLATASMLNPQTAYGADVVSRIQCARRGELRAMCEAVRGGMAELIRAVCAEGGVSAGDIGVVSVVGNPCMQQLFLGMPVENLAQMPFAPALTEMAAIPAAEYLPACAHALLLVVPDISGYVGADTLGCALATGLDASEDVVLLVDIGTNGEMLLAGKGRILACSAAAGPALEGSGILCGMRAVPGAIDRVWLENGVLCSSAIGDTEPLGICGSGLIDAAASMLDAGYINCRGRIQAEEELNGQRFLRLTDSVYLTQEDIRGLQMAKGAIAAGIELMCAELGISPVEIDRVLLAGAFGSFIRPESACRIGLLPVELQNRIAAVGNAAGSGACMLACDREQQRMIQRLVQRIEFLELAALPGFRRSFARNMNF